MKSRFNRILKILLCIFVLTISFTNRDLFSVGSDFLIPVRIVFLGICALVLVYLLNVFRTQGVMGTVNWIKAQLKDNLVVYLILLWVIRVISLVNSRNLSASLNLLSFYTSMIIIYLILKYLFSKDIHFGLKLFKMYLLSVVFSVFYALTQILANLFFGIKLPGLLVGGNYFRVPGPFYDANHLPAFLLTGIPMFVTLGWFFDRPWKRFLAFFFALVASLVLFLTFSRSGVIGFGVVTFLSIVFIFYYKYWSKLLVPIGLVSIILLIVFLSDRTSHSLVDRIGSIFNSAEKSTQAHTLLIRGELDLFMRNPLLGVGYGSFSEHFRASYYGQQHLKVDQTADIRLPAHSIWLEVLTETGLLGIILYILVIFTIVKELFMAIRGALNKEWRLYFISLFASSVALLVSGIFYSYNLEFFWFFLLSSYLLARNYKKLVPDSAIGEDLDKAEEVNWPEILTPLAVVGVSGFVIFSDLGRTTLVEYDEAIYGTIAKNMIRTGDYLVPTFRDGLPWFEKPPLYLWLTAPLVKLFGIDAYPVRFWSALFGVATFFVTYLLGRLWFNRFVGVVSSVALLGSFHFIRYSRMGMTDITLTFFMTSSILLFYLARYKPIVFAISGLCLGLAFMTKGMVSLLVLPVLVLMWLEGGKQNSRLFGIWYFVFGFLVVTLPWHLYMYQRFGQEFLDSYLGYHILIRFAGEIEDKSEPWFTYLVVLRNSLRIWFPILLLSLPLLVYRLYKSEKRESKALLLVWFMSILIPLSLAKSKLIWYLVPIYPVSALISSWGIWQISTKLYEKYKQKIKLDKMSSATILVVLTSLITFVYLTLSWNVLGERDYNRDALTLINKKTEVEPTGRYPLIVLGVGEGITSFYGEGNVDVAPENVLEGLMSQDLRRYYIVNANLARETLIKTEAKFPASIIATSGKLALILRHGVLLK